MSDLGKGKDLAPSDLDRIRADAVFWLGQLFPQDVSGAACQFFDYVLDSLRALPVEQRMEAMGMVAVGTYGPPELRTTTYTEPLPDGAVRRCRDCGGHGYTNEHDPSCRGDEQRCQDHCPVEAPCRTCQASGYEIQRDKPLEDADVPF